MSHALFLSLSSFLLALSQVFGGVLPADELFSSQFGGFQNGIEESLFGLTFLW